MTVHVFQIVALAPGDDAHRRIDCACGWGAFASDDMPTRLASISSEGKWTYYDGRNCIEPFRVPRPDEYERLYTAREVAEILAASHRRMVKS